MKQTIICVLALCRYSLCVIQHLAHRDSARELRTLLLDSYFKYSHPYKHNIRDFSINAIFTLVSLLDLDQTEEIFSFTGHIALQWVDPDLSWNDTKYKEVIPSMRFGADDIWTPDVMVGNGVGTLSYPSTSLDLTVQSSGLVSMNIFDAFYTKCDVDMTLYPFDRQFCLLGIIISPSAAKLNVIANYEMAKYVPTSSEWILERYYVTPVNMTYLHRVVETVNFQLKRQSIFYVMNVIFPILLLSILNACAFLLPVQSGERMSFLISILVSYAVFLSYITEVMPKSGIASRMAIYLVLVLSQSGLAIFATLGILNFYHYGVICNSSKRITVSTDNTAREIQTNDDIILKVRSVDRKMSIVFIIMALLSILVFWV